MGHYEREEIRELQHRLSKANDKILALQKQNEKLTKELETIRNIDIEKMRQDVVDEYEAQVINRPLSLLNKAEQDRQHNYDENG